MPVNRRKWLQTARRLFLGEIPYHSKIWRLKSKFDDVHYRDLALNDIFTADFSTEWFLTLILVLNDFFYAEFITEWFLTLILVLNDIFYAEF